jgi:hypothetical protein
MKKIDHSIDLFAIIGLSAYAICTSIYAPQYAVLFGVFLAVMLLYRINKWNVDWNP